MIYLDLVTVYLPEARRQTAGAMTLREFRVSGQTFLRLTDDRWPDEEVLLPVERDEESEPNELPGRLTLSAVGQI